MRGWAAVDPRVRYLSFSRNFGHQAAFTAGLEHARGDVVVLLDSDLQHPPALIPALLAKWRAGADVVTTRRAGWASPASPPGRPDSHGRGFFHRHTSRWFARLYRWLSTTPVPEDMADYCLLSRKAVDGLLSLRETHRYLRGMVQWLGFSSASVEFRPASRRAGVSKFSPLRLASYALDALLSASCVPWAQSANTWGGSTNRSSEGRSICSRKPKRQRQRIGCGACTGTGSRKKRSRRANRRHNQPDVP
jgi:dolichol-phosphate mannosyltransferase